MKVFPGGEECVEGHRSTARLAITCQRASVVAAAGMTVFKVAELPSNQRECQGGDDNAGSYMPVAERQRS